MCGDYRKRALRAGVIGLGVMGSNHARIYKTLPEVELVGVHDVDYTRTAKVAKEYETKPFRSLADLLNTGLDVVSIATPTTSHFELAMKCAEAGVNILVEKPLTATLEEAKRLLLQCEENKVRLMVGHVERFNPVIRAIKEVISGERIVSVDLTRVGPKPPRIKDVGVVTDLAIHDIDILRFITGREIVSLFPLVSRDGDNFENYASLSFQLQGGIMAHITVNWITPYKVRKIQIACRNAFIEGDLRTREAIIYRLANGGKAYIAETLEVPREEPLRREIEEFINCVRHGSGFPISGYDAFRALEIAQCCVRNAGQRMECMADESDKEVSCIDNYK